MANLQKCSRCKSEVDVSFFGLNRKKQPYKTCDNCRTKSRESKAKQRQQLDVKPLKRTDTDFADEEFENMKNELILTSWRCAKMKAYPFAVTTRSECSGNYLRVLMKKNILTKNHVIV